MNLRILAILSVLFTSAVGWSGTITVVDPDGNPLAGAQVLIGEAPNSPFSGNQLTTDNKGQFTAPTAWTAPLPVTVEGADLVRTTHYDVSPSGAVLTVTPTDGDGRIQVQGTMTDFGNLRTDGKVDAGVFIPALPLKKLIYFDIGWMVSPENDTISVIGRDVAIPSNIVLPRQTESYILPITLDKPNFRMFVRRPGSYRFLALHAQFPMKRVVDDIRSGVPIYDVINNGTLISSGLVDLNLNGSVSNLSVPVSTLQFSNNVNVQAPALNSDDVVISVALSQIDDSGELVPSDIKRLRNGQSQALKTPNTKSTPQVLSVWMKENQNLTYRTRSQVTADDLFNIPYSLIYDVFTNQQQQVAQIDYRQVSIAHQATAGAAPQFISLVAPPRVTGAQLSVTPPATVAGITPERTVLIYSAIKVLGSGQVKTEQRTRLWELSVPGWVSALTLPKLATPVGGKPDKYRWEVLYIGNQNGSLSHVSRNAIDL